MYTIKNLYLIVILTCVPVLSYASNTTKEESNEKNTRYNITSDFGNDELTIESIPEEFCSPSRYYLSRDEFRRTIKNRSIVLNDSGFYYYKKKDWAMAKKLFLQAAHYDHTNGFALFNYACTAALECQSNCSKQHTYAIIEALNRATTLNQYFSKKIIHDSDLDQLRTLFSSKRLGGHNSMELDPTWELSLDDKAKAQFIIQTSGGDAGMGDPDYPSPPIVWETIDGEYTIIGNMIYIYYHAKMPDVVCDYWQTYLTKELFTEYERSYRKREY